MAARYGTGSTRGRKITGPDTPLYEPAPVIKSARGQAVAKGLVSMASLKTGAKTAGFNAQVGAALAAPKVKAAGKAAVATPGRKLATAGAGGAAAGAALAGSRPAQAQPIYVAPYSGMAKAYRQHDPEHQRQQRLGAAQAGLVLGGGYAGHRGVRGIQADTKKLRETNVRNGVGAKDTKLGTLYGRRAIAVSRRNALLTGGGAAAIAAAGGVRHHANSNKGRTYR